MSAGESQNLELEPVKIPPVKEFKDPHHNPAEGPRDLRFNYKYAEWMPDVIREVMSRGGTLVQAAAQIKVTRQLLLRWCDPTGDQYHHDIAVAVEEGKTLSQAYWESDGKTGMWAGKQFNTGVFTFMMKNRFRHDYSETPQAEPEKPKKNPVIDAMNATANQDWETPENGYEDRDDHGN